VITHLTFNSHSLDVLALAEKYPELSWVIPIHIIMLCGITWAIGGLCYNTDCMTFGCALVLGLIGASTRVMSLMLTGVPKWDWVMIVGTLCAGAGVIMTMWRVSFSGARARQTFVDLGIREALPVAPPMLDLDFHPDGPESIVLEDASSNSVEMEEYLK